MHVNRFVLATMWTTMAVMLAAEEAPPAAKIDMIRSPVKTARCWPNATLVANARGEWQFVAGTMNYKGTTDFVIKRQKLEGTGREYLTFRDADLRPPAEWVLVNLASGQSRTMDMPAFHGHTSARAENGRVFFPGDYNQMYYYDPLEDTLKIMGEFLQFVPFKNDRGLYKFLAGPDGYLYGSTQSYSGKTSVLQLNPDTLTWKVFSDIGSNERGQGLTYGYYLAVDPPWAYVAVGQGNWELWAVNVETGEKKKLGERYGDGSRVTVSGPDEVAVRADLSGGDKPRETLWCVKGEVYPLQPKGADGTYKLPFPLLKDRPCKHLEWTVTKPLPPPPAPPELNTQQPVAIDETGKGTVQWRPQAGTGEWKTVTFTITRAETEAICSLQPLPDGSLLGAVRQYNGFFHYYPQDKRYVYHGKLGPSEPKMAGFDGKVYYFGYPSVGLYAYDPAQDWKVPATSDPTKWAPTDNPRFIAYFNQYTDAHHSKFIVPGPNGRLYLLGHRERWSTGAGLGYYEPATDKRFGLKLDMKDLEPAGLVLLPKLGRVVVSGKVIVPPLPAGTPADAPPATVTAQLRVYDLDLKAVEQLTVKDGIASTGSIYDLGQENTFAGVLKGDKETSDQLYLFDLARKAATVWVKLDGKLQSPLFRKPADGSCWLICSGVLCRLNPETLAVTPVQKLQEPLELPVWIGDTLYGTDRSASW